MPPPAWPARVLPLGALRRSGVRAGALGLGLVMLAGCATEVSGTATVPGDALASTPATSPPPADGPGETGSATIATPKSASLDDDLCALLTVEEIGAALGGEPEPLEPSTFLCSFGTDTSFGLMSFTALSDADPQPAPSQVGGNTTVTSGDDAGTCEIAVALNDDPDSLTSSLSVLVFTDDDPCAAAAALVQTAFDRLPG